MTTVATVADALRQLEICKPAACILDLMLPDGDGAIVLERIRNSNLKINVAVTTASTDSARIERVKSLRADHIIRKPIDLGMLLKALGN